MYRLSTLFFTYCSKFYNYFLVEFNIELKIKKVLLETVYLEFHRMDLDAVWFKLKVWPGNI